MRIFRALVKTHHMTSRKKIQVLTRSAKGLGVGVLIKTGRSPGVMVVEGGEGGVRGWVGGVKVSMLSPSPLPLSSFLPSFLPSFRVYFHCLD